MKEYKYKAFISYSHKDKNFAKWLHRRIENYKIPKSLREKYHHLPANLQRSIFRDEEELPTASELSDNLLYAMNNSELLLVVCSPASVKSKWVNSEIQYYKRIHGENSVLAIIKEGEPNATDMDDEDNEAFPNALRHKVDSLGGLTQERTEPIAGDARSYWDREMALMKMIAGILKVDFADLWEREKRERNKRRFITLGIVSVFIALSIYTSTQFLGDRVNKELEQVKNDIAMIEYSIRNDNLDHSILIELNKKLKKLKKLKENKEDTQKTLGSLKTSLGKEAQEVYRDKGTKEAIKVLNSKVVRARQESQLKEISKEKLTLAKLYIESYQFEKAQQSYEGALEIFYDYDNVFEFGIFLYNQKQYKEAITVYEKLLESKLTDFQKAQVYLSMGNALHFKAAWSFDEMEKRKYEVEDTFQKALTIYRNIAKDNSPENILRLAFILNNLSVVYQGKKAKKFLEESMILSNQLLTLEKNNHKYNDIFALNLFNKGRLLSLEMKYKEAEQFYLKSLSIYTDLANQRPDVYTKQIVMVNDALRKILNNLNKTLEEKENFHLIGLQQYTKLAKKNPQAYCDSFRLLTTETSSLYEKNMNYKEAEKVLIDALDICDKTSWLNGTIPFNNFYINDLLRKLYFRQNDLTKLEQSYVKYKKNNLAIKYHPEVSILKDLATLYLMENKTEKAKQSYISSAKISRGYLKEANKKTHADILLLSFKYSDLSNVLVELAFLYKKDKQLNELQKVNQELLNIYEDFKKINNIQYNTSEASILQNIAKLYITVNEIGKAKKSYEKALEIYEGSIKESEKKEFSFTIKTSYSFKAWIYNRLGELYEKDKELLQAAKHYLKALDIYESLAKANQTTHDKDIAWTISRLGNIYKQNIELEKAEKYYDIALSILPATYKDKIAYEFDMLGTLYEKNNKFNEAEKVYIKSLSIYRGLEKTTANILSIAWTLDRLGLVYSGLEQRTKSKQSYSEALFMYRQLTKQEPLKYKAYVAWTLSRLGELHEKDKQIHEAKKIYKEILSIYEELEMSNPEIYKTHLIWIHDKINNLPKKII